MEHECHLPASGGKQFSYRRLRCIGGELLCSQLIFCDYSVYTLADDMASSRANYTVLPRVDIRTLSGRLQ